jgi:tetratricopeptide (TPR) repeat protein
MPPDESASRSRSALPAKIGRYRILDRVGRGAMGVVYSAHDDAMGRPVAVKVLMGDLESDPETRARFYREAQAAAGLLHPNIITIYDAGEDQGRSYIAMQLLEGWPLAAYLKQPEAAPIERKLDLMVQMCEGLAAAHGRGIVHRDLKPGNLFVQSDGLLKILDFGVARLADSSMTATGAMLGTPDYMSPEQARGTQVDTRSDIFSSGAVFYFMLTGRKPFPGPDLPAVLRQLQSEQPAPLRDTESPPELTRLIMQALAKDPSDRPPRVQELLAGIVRFRRHYQSETRKLAAEAGARLNALVTSVAELRRAATLLEIDGDDEEPAVLRSLRERYPVVVERGGAGLESVAFDRARVIQVLSELDAERTRLDADLVSRGAHARAIETGEQALRAGDARSALRHFEQVRRDCPSSRRAVALAAQATGEAREQEARERRIAEMTAAAKSALDARDWKLTLEKCQEALAVVPDLPEVAAIQAEAQQHLAREQRRRALLIQQALDRATVAVEDGRFDEAEAALREVEGLDPQAPALGEIRAYLAEARQAAAEAERVRQLAAGEVRRARASFRRGRYDEAVSGLQTFLEAHPGAAQAVDEAARLEAIRRRMDQSAQERRRRVGALLASARADADRGAFEEALATAREAIRCDPSNPDVSAAFDDTIGRRLEARIEEERTRSRELRAAGVTPLLAAAREALDRGYIAVALDAALGAQRLDPDRSDVAELVSRLRRLENADDTDDVYLAEEPLSPRPAAPPPAPPPPSPAAAERPPDGGVLSHVNQWAADLLRRRLPNR